MGIQMIGDLGENMAPKNVLTEGQPLTRVMLLSGDLRQEDGWALRVHYIGEEPFVLCLHPEQRTRLLKVDETMGVDFDDRLAPQPSAQVTKEELAEALSLVVDAMHETAAQISAFANRLRAQEERE